MGVYQSPTGVVEPKYRYGLKARLAQCGYRTAAQFCRAADLDPATFSRIVNGWELPSVEIQRRLCFYLGLSGGELRELL